MPRSSSSKLLVLPLLALCVLLPAGPVRAQAQGEAMQTAPVPLDGNAVGGEADVMSPDEEAVTGAVMKEQDMLQYCVNIADRAREARYARIQRELSEADKEVSEKLDRLESRIAELKSYVERREAFMKMADGAVLAIYRSMRPDAAAAQLGELDILMASAILMKLPPERSSAIMNEMKPKQAAQISKTLIISTQGAGQAAAEGGGATSQ